MQQSICSGLDVSRLLSENGVRIKTSRKKGHRLTFARFNEPPQKKVNPFIKWLKLRDSMQITRVHLDALGKMFAFGDVARL